MPQEAVRAFVEAMPDTYARDHDAAHVEGHAQIVARRRGAVVHVEIAPGPSLPGATWLCVVADDRPGLLSELSAVLSAHELDVLAARAYCRTRTGLCDEAVDLFCVRRIGTESGPLRESDLGSLSRSMASLLSGETTIQEIARRVARTSRPPFNPPVAVYFNQRERDLLHVEATDRPGLLLAITLTIFRERLSIIRSHVVTVAGMARDEFQLAELDGTPLSPSRRELVAEKVRQAVSR